LNKTDAVETVRLNWKNMPEHHKKKIKRGEIIARFTSDMMALKWMEKKEVTILSMYHTSTMETIQKCDQEKQKVTAIVTYNNTGSTSCSIMERKRTKIWNKKFFRHLLHLSLKISSTIQSSYDHPGVLECTLIKELY